MVLYFQEDIIIADQRDTKEKMMNVETKQFYVSSEFLLRSLLQLSSFCLHLSRQKRKPFRMQFVFVSMSVYICEGAHLYEELHADARKTRHTFRCSLLIEWRVARS